jgi:hypothetical protein
MASLFIAELNGMGFDGNFIADFMQEGIFSMFETNPDRVRQAKQFLTEQGIQNVNRLTGLLSKFVLEFDQTQKNLLQQSVDLVDAEVSQSEEQQIVEAAAPEEQKKAKPKKKKITGAELKDFLNLKTPNYIQRYSDDESLVTSAPGKMALVSPVQTVIAPPRRLRKVVVASTANPWISKSEATGEDYVQLVREDERKKQQQPEEVEFVDSTNESELSTQVTEDYGGFW